MNEIPAWDTWILFTESFLLSWIPPELVSDVQSAIDCNAEESILWAADVQHLFIHELRTYGLLH